MRKYFAEYIEHFTSYSLEQARLPLVFGTKVLLTAVSVFTICLLPHFKTLSYGSV